ncbi:hypothetical protein PanWU01x14_285870 [Parasponia andersonii]|uniref:Uncharacterized protein n=1 Tax=Parasponia andersonii TaxID=3476 RepID=A0A2P5AZD1_PARAD|nr:hypothetical protein PanWU01x14_285870 [Parasponia andersonii]
MARTRWTSKKRKAIEDSDFESPPPQSSSPRLKKKKVEEAGTETSPIRLSTSVSSERAERSIKLFKNGPALRAAMTSMECPDSLEEQPRFVD